MGRVVSPGATTIDEYLAALPADKRAALQFLRRAIRSAAPGAEECISYQLPAFRLDGRVIVWFGAAANHCAFYPGAVVESHKTELEGYDTSKGTIRFQPDHPLPVSLVRTLVKAAAARRAARPATSTVHRQRRGRLEDNMVRSQVVRRLDERWNALLASYDGLSQQEMTEPGVTGTWSVKDIIAHVTSWEDEALKHLPSVLAGKRPPRYSVTHGGIDAFNAQVTARNRDVPLAEVLRRRDRTHRRLLAFIAGVPDEALGGETRARRRLRLDTYGHYAVHTRAIRKWRKQRPNR